MSSVFADIKLSWDGKEYVIPADGVMRALLCVEEVITLHEMEHFQRRGTVPLVRLSQAYGSVLRYAGCKVDDEKVYQRLFMDKAFDVSKAIAGLMLMMLPPPELNLSVEAKSEGNVSKAAAKQSRKRTKSP